MADPQYTLLPWARRGLGSLIAGASPTNYASLPISLVVNGTALASMPQLRLIGPGDIAAVDPGVVIRTEPRDRIDAFEPNYLAAVEFSAPDFPWLFTPSGPTGDRLRPWICLVVLPDSDGVTLTTSATGPPVLRIGSPLDPLSELPDLDQIDFWAHTQVTGDTGLTGNPSGQLSRLISPRALEPGRKYLACVVPTYRAGVNAGLGLPVDDSDLAPAWDASLTPPVTLPVYYSFRFQTGPGGDFASLARRIVPPAAPLDAGIRMMDASQPGFGAPSVAKVQLGLEGALRSVNAASTPWPAGAQAAYQKLLRNALVPPAGPVPVVAPPVYGGTQSGAKLPLPGAPPVWLGDLNLDPRTRAAASAGAQVVQGNQNKLVASAWSQAGQILKANQLLRQAQLAQRVSASFYRRHLDNVSGDGVYMQLTAPVHARVLLANVTVRSAVAASRLPVSALSGAMRRIARTRGPIGRQVYAAAKPQLVDRLNVPPGTGSNALTVTPPSAPRAGMVALDQISPAIQIARMTPANIRAVPGWATTVVATGGGLTKASTSAAPVLPGIAAPAARTEGQQTTTDGGAKESGGGGVRVPPPLIDWNSDPDVPDFFKGASTNLPTPIVFPSDAAALAKMQDAFRAASIAVGGYLNTPGPVFPDPPPLGGSAALAPVRAQLHARLDPQITIPRRLGVRIPLSGGPDPLQPQPATVQFPDAMYAALAALSPDWMLPGISNVPNNTAALLQTNQRFIEAFMIGLNEEMARELKWREFPIALTSTYFHNFWGNSDGSPDIPSIDTFDPQKGLGQHAATQAPGGDLVLLIRADLFRRYPNSVVSAVRAKWSADGKTRILDTTERRDPIFRGQFGNDINFFGFNVDDPLGSNDPAAGNAGWYFVIEEHPTEPHFGLEPADSTAPIQYWNDVRWSNVTPQGKFLSPTPAVPTPNLEPAPKVIWGQSAAAMAYILLRRPVRVAFHGRALLPAEGA